MLVCGCLIGYIYLLIGPLIKRGVWTPLVIPHTACGIPLFYCAYCEQNKTQSQKRTHAHARSHAHTHTSKNILYGVWKTIAKIFAACWKCITFNRRFCSSFISINRWEKMFWKLRGGLELLYIVLYIHNCINMLTLLQTNQF